MTVRPVCYHEGMEMNISTTRTFLTVRQEAIDTLAALLAAYDDPATLQRHTVGMEDRYYDLVDELHRFFPELTDGTRRRLQRDLVRSAHQQNTNP